MVILIICMFPGQHVIGGRLKKDEFKIVYVAPMKALAAEVTEKFSKRQSSLFLIPSTGPLVPFIFLPSLSSLALCFLVLI